MSRKILSRLIFPILLSVVLLLTACDPTPTPTPTAVYVGCSVPDLIQAIDDANQNPDHSEIHLGFCTYTLTQADNAALVDGINVYNGLPAITTEITIRAVSSAQILVQKDPGEPDFGHFFVQSTGKLNLYDLSLEDGVRPRGGSVVNKGGDFFASDVTFVDNTASTREEGESSLGGAIYSTDGRVRLIDDCIFQNNVTTYNGAPRANHGGAVYNKDGGLLVSNSHFNWNQADGNGGAIYTIKNSANDEGAAIQISDSDFRENTAEHDGGAIAFIGDFDAIIIATSYFEMNQAENYGGGIYSEGSGVVANYTDFRLNSASYGGAIYTRRMSEGDSSSYHSEYADYDYNSASESGGAIFSENADLELREDHFADNSAVSCGAIRNGGSPGLDVEAGDLATAPQIPSSADIRMSVFYENIASQSHGGALCHYMGEIYIGGTIFSLNETPAFGGALIIMDEAEIFASNFLGNTARFGGGAAIGFPVSLHFSDGSSSNSISYLDFSVAIDGSRFSANQAYGHGGGIWTHHAGTVNISKTTIDSNIANFYGGGINQKEGDLYINNSTISCNHAYSGGGIYSWGDLITDPLLDINHTTVAYNIASGDSLMGRVGGGGLNIDGLVTVENSLVVKNQSGDCLYGQNLSASLAENVDSDNTCGFGKTKSNPLIGQLNGITHPVLPGSPLIDVVQNCGLPDDQHGTIRPQGAGCEPGSFEYDPSNPADIPQMPPMPSTSDCDPFAGMEVSVMTLGLRGETMTLPVVLRADYEIPGLNPEAMNGSPLYEYRAQLGDNESLKCGLQGFPDRLYCLFKIPSHAPGMALDFKLYLNECEDPVYLQPLLSIPEPKAGDPGLTCTADLKTPECEEAGGKMSPGTTTAPICVCP